MPHRQKFVCKVPDVIADPPRIAPIIRCYQANFHSRLPAHFLGYRPLPAKSAVMHVLVFILPRFPGMFSPRKAKLPSLLRRISSWKGTSPVFKHATATSSTVYAQVK